MAMGLCELFGFVFMKFWELMLFRGTVHSFHIVDL